MKKVLLLSALAATLVFFTTVQVSYAAAPANDDICSAVALPLTGVCVTTQTNVDATADYYGGCVNSNFPSVWYTFTLSSASVNAVDITFASITGGETDVSLLLVSGAACSTPTGVASNCGDITGTFSFYNLSDGTTYYLAVTTNPGASELDNFDICATEYDGVGTITGPEQDCQGALPACTDTVKQVNSYTGVGDIVDIPGSGATCLYSGENNSVWYTFTAQSASTLSFTLQTTKDYDWAVYDLTAIGGCDGVFGATPLVCNYSDDAGNTGLTTTADDALPRSEGWNGPNTMDGFTLTSGNDYAIIVDNWTGDNTGFNLIFGTGSAVIDATKPTMSSATPNCTDNTILITMSEKIKCLTVVEADFLLENTTTTTSFTSAITKVIGYNCATVNGALTTQIEITHDGTLTTGVYEIKIGTSPVLADKCDNIILAGSTINFNYTAALTYGVVSPATLCTAGGAVSLDVDGADNVTGVTYTLNPGSQTSTTDGTFTVNPVATTTYTTEVVFGCTRTVSTTVTVEDNVITSVSPGTQEVCSPDPGTATISATTTINGVACVGCTYVWSDAQTTSTATGLSAGTYTVTTTTANSCAGDNTPSGVITVVSGGASTTCDIYYVNSWDGATASGLTKGAPTSLTDALTKANCTSSVIKMARGVYTASKFVNISNFITIEGGFNSTFTTKYSDMGGGTNSTTIRRDNTADSDNAKTCTAFRVNSGADSWRIQDVRIEMPGSTNVTAHTNGTEVSNYGINLLGSGSTGYNITRCYIDAGIGANP